MQTWIVGGAVRDALLGLPVNDRDWVVVGATPQQLIAAGFLPVGKDFPVFLHPQTREEYALARTERKTAAGYHGFVFHAEPGVTLEEDLARRDLTINAMAQGPDGRIVDPFNGRRDLQQRVLRHVTEAFREDPVRILRLARFAARFGFAVAQETMTLMKRMVESGEADYLVPERVWQELARGLAEPHPERMFEVLERAGFRARALPQITAWPARFSGSLAVRFAQLAWPLSEQEIESLCESLRAPNEVRELALTASRTKEHLGAGSAEAMLALLKGADAFRRPERFAELLEAARLADPSIDTARIEKARAAAAAVDAGAIARQADASSIAERIDAARLKAIRSLC